MRVNHSLPSVLRLSTTFLNRQTKKQLMSFMGMCSYCRVFIPNFAQLEVHLSDIIHAKTLNQQTQFSGQRRALQSFVDLKLALQQAPTLGIPDLDKPFTQAVDECNGCTTSVLLQQHCDKLRPVGYFSAKLDPVSQRSPKMPASRRCR